MNKYNQLNNREAELANLMHDIKNKIDNPETKHRNINIEFKNTLSDGTPSIFIVGNVHIEEANQLNSKTRIFRHKWQKGTQIKAHYHANAIEYLWVTSGKMLVEYFNENMELINSVIIEHTNQNQPISFGKNVIHSITAMTDDLQFTARFEYE